MEDLQNGTVKNNPNRAGCRRSGKRLPNSILLEEKINKIKLARAPDFFVARPLKDFDATSGDVSISLK